MTGEITDAAPGTTLPGTASTPTAAELLVRHFAARAAACPQEVAFRFKELGLWQEVSWAEYRSQTAELAVGLREAGLRSGDRVALLAATSPEWLYLDLAVQSLGAELLGLYPTTADGDLADLVGDATPTVLVAGNAGDLERLAAADRSLTAQRFVINDAGAVGRATTLAAVREAGRAVLADDPSAWDRLLEEVRPDAPIGIFCTAGTTGRMNGVVLSSANVVSALTSALAHTGAPSQRDRTVSRLPLANLMERQLHVYGPILFGYVSHLPEDVATIGEATKEVQPTILLGTPGEWTTSAGRIELGVEQTGRLRRATFRLALAMRQGQAGAAAAGRRPSPLWRLLSWTGYWLGCRGVLDQLGYAKLQRVLTIGAALPAPTVAAWRRLGVELHEGYSLTEAGGFVALRSRASSAMEVLDHVALVAAGDGQLQVASEAFLGYLGARRAPHDEGWLATGDVGTVDASGQVRISGRTVDLLGLGGRTVPAGAFEDQLRLSPFIREAVVCALDDATPGALIELDPVTTSAWARARGVVAAGYFGLVASPEVNELISDEVAKANATLADADLPTITQLRLLPHGLDRESGQDTTPVGCVRRNSIAERHRGLFADQTPTRPATEGMLAGGSQ